MQNYELKIIVGRDRGCDGKIRKHIIQADNDLDALFKVFTQFDLCASWHFEEENDDKEDLELKNKILTHIKTNNPEGVQLLKDLYFKELDLSDYYDDIVYLKDSQGNVVIEDDIDLEEWFS